MALLTNYEDGKVTHTALAVRYSLGAKVNDTYYEVHRYTTKTWSYYGLDYATAIACRNTITGLGYLKRTFYLWRLDANGQPVKDDAIMMPDAVEVVHDDGAMWHVDVQVNEDDMMYTDDLMTDPSLLDWPPISSWDYDEDTTP